MPNPDSPWPPRLSSEPVPLPAEYARGRYAGAHAVYDLDRVLELPYIQGWLSVPPRTEVTNRAEKETALAAQHQYFAEVVAYCCAGLTDSDGQPLPGSPALDDVAGWAAQSRTVVLWLATKGLAGPAGAVDAPFQVAATDPTPP